MIMEVHSEEEFKTLCENKTLVKGDKVIFRCERCGAYVDRAVRRASNKDKPNFYKMLCQKCKAKETNLMTWGVEEKMSSPYFQQLLVNGMINKYGVPRALQDPELHEKAKQTTIDRFGENPFGSTEMLERVKAGNRKNYGVDWSLQCPEVAEKSKQSMLDKYGVTNLFYSKEFQENLKANIGAKFGKNVGNPSQIPEIQAKVRTSIKERYNGHTPSYTYIYNGISFDSSWELAVWIYAIHNGICIEREPIYLEFTYGDKVHTVTPDFRINGKLVEIKGSHLADINEDGSVIAKNPYSKPMYGKEDYTENDLEYIKSFSTAKYNCEIANGVEFWGEDVCIQYVNWVEMNFGKGYLESFRLNVCDRPTVTQRPVHKATEVSDPEKVNNINNCISWDKPEGKKYKCKPGTHNVISVEERYQRAMEAGKKLYI